MLLDSPSGRRELEVHIRPVRDIDFDGFVITGEDVTETRLLEARLESTGQHDQLTGLLSREAMITKISGSLRGLRTPNNLGLALIDINDFGAWNDSLGRQGGGRDPAGGCREAGIDAPHGHGGGAIRR